MKNVIFRQGIVVASIFTLIVFFWGTGGTIAKGGEDHGGSLSLLSSDIGGSMINTLSECTPNTASAYPALNLTTEVSSIEVTSGETLTYTIHLLNKGTVDLNTTITATLPLQVIPSDPHTWTPVIVKGETWTEQFTATVQNGYSGPLANVVQVTTVEGISSKAIVTSCANDCQKQYLPLIQNDGSRVFDFEGDHQGWGKHTCNGQPLPGIGVTISNEEAHTGNYSLRLDDFGPYSHNYKSTTPDFAVSFDAHQKQVTAWVKLPLDADAPPIPVVIYIQDNFSTWYQSSSENLVPGQWVLISFDTSDATSAQAPFKTLGLHFTPDSYTGPVFIDSITVK